MGAEQLISNERGNPLFLFPAGWFSIPLSWNAPPHTTFASFHVSLITCGWVTAPHRDCVFENQWLMLFAYKANTLLFAAQTMMPQSKCRQDNHTDYWYFIATDINGHPNSQIFFLPDVKIHLPWPNQHFCTLYLTISESLSPPETPQKPDPTHQKLLSQ